MGESMNTKEIVGCTAASAVALALWWVAGSAAAQSKVDTVLTEQKQVNNESAASQKKIDKISDDTGQLLSEFRALNQQIDNLQIYNRQLQTLVNGQQEEMTSLREQIENVTVVARDLTPLMLQMLDTLEQFVALDVPFLQAERANRVANLREMMDRADVTVAEKFRRVLEAYTIENDYGRTIESYRGDLSSEGKTRTVDFLRIGRVALLYSTQDGEETGWWNPMLDGGKGAWEVLPSSYRGSIQTGIRMALKQTAPDLLSIPVIAPEKLQ
jgi:hypothetical protein